MALYHNIDLAGAYIQSDGDLQQGSTTYITLKEGGGQNPVICTSSGVPRILTPTLNSSDKDRCEIIVDQNILADQTYYVGFNVYIPYDAVSLPFPNNWFMLTQFRQNGDGTHNPGLSIDLTTSGSDLNLSLVARSDGSDTYEQLYNQKLNGSSDDWYFNRWFNVIIKAHISNSGVARMWIYRPWNNNGIDSGDKTHDMLLPLSETASTLKFGLYRGVSSNANVYGINFSNYRVGQYFSDVKSW
jgi:hypothetical protein